MEYHKISKLLKDLTVSKFVTGNNLMNSQYSANKNIRFRTPMLRSDLGDYSDLYIVVKRAVDPLANAAIEKDKEQKDVI